MFTVDKMHFTQRASERERDLTIKTVRHSEGGCCHKLLAMDDRAKDSSGNSGVRGEAALKDWFRISSDPRALSRHYMIHPCVMV